MNLDDYTLELTNIFYSGQVEPGSLTQKLFGNVKTGVILKNVSMTVHSGEVLAVLGSKGSGKKALLDVISRRAQGPVRGQILLNSHPMSLKLFQQRCGYVTHTCDFITGLTVEQTLNYTPIKVENYERRTKIKQIMADLALSQVASRCVEDLTLSEYRRLMIGTQLIKDPIVLLLDEPTWNLDPLNTYLIISILSNISKKYGTAIVLTMEKPRSDVFPFLERVLYLCLGDVVYTGSTRQMLEYFNAIGFPCPHLENPLMYYLCLSTVDRRSRERFIESNHQIATLVEKFKTEGNIYEKASKYGPSTLNTNRSHKNNKFSLFIDNRNPLFTFWNVYFRTLLATFNCNKNGISRIFQRLFLLPLYFFILWTIYRDMQLVQHTFISRSGLLFTCLASTYFLGILNSILLFPRHRTRYYQESQEGLYGAIIFLLSYNFVTIPFSVFTVSAGAAIIFQLLNSYENLEDYLYFVLILWSCYLFAEQQTMTILMIVKDQMKAAIFSIYITTIYLALCSGQLRSYKGLQDWLVYLTYGMQTRYVAAFLNREFFLVKDLSEPLPYDSNHTCTNMNFIETSTKLTNYCRYGSGREFLNERFARNTIDSIFNTILDADTNLSIAFAFVIGSIICNFCLYLLPLPTFIKAKFRE